MNKTNEDILMQEPNTINQTTQDYSWWSIIGFFIFFMFLYDIIIMIVMNIILPYVMDIDIPFKTESFFISVAPASASFLFMLPVIFVIFLIQKIRKKPYYKPKKHLLIGAIIFFILIVSSQLLELINILLSSIIDQTLKPIR